MNHIPPPPRLARRRFLMRSAAVGLALVHGPGHAAYTRSGGERRASADTLTETPPARATPVTQPAWWLGFRDPALDELMRAALQVPDLTEDRRAALGAQVATLYLTARWLIARLAVAHGLNEVLGQQRRWAALEGPTAHAAQVITELDRAAADIDDKVTSIADRCAELISQLRELSPVPGDVVDEWQKALLSQTTVPQFELPLRRGGARMTLGEGRGADALALQAAEVRRLEQAGLALRTRFDAARTAMQAGQANARDVLAIYQRLLFETDRVLQAQAALAIGWVRVLANSH